MQDPDDFEHTFSEGFCSCSEDGGPCRLGVFGPWPTRIFLSIVYGTALPITPRIVMGDRGSGLEQGLSRIFGAASPPCGIGPSPPVGWGFARVWVCNESNSPLHAPDMHGFGTVPWGGRGPRTGLASFTSTIAALSGLVKAPASRNALGDRPKRARDRFLGLYT